jgi:transcriptional regulator with XRE-family HTH domain
MLERVEVIRFGLGVRALRRRRGWSQAGLADRVGVSRSVIWRIERGRADRVTLATIGRVAAALDGRLELRLLWHGEGLDRLLDAAHARLVDLIVTRLASAGWLVSTEVSFSVQGERGSIDVLAFHPDASSLLVVEVKSVVPDLQAMLMSLDRKGRLAPVLARERGWSASTVNRLLVLPDDRTARRRVDAHDATFRTALPARTVAIRAWMRSPSGTMNGVLFLADAPHTGRRQRRS